MSQSISWVVIFLALINGYSVGFGVNLRKWYGWIQIFAGFLFGFFLFFEDPGLGGKIAVGVIVAGILLILGPPAWKRRHS